MARLVDRTGLSERTVQRAIKRLEAADILRVKHGGGRGLANVYRFANPVTLDDTVSEDKPRQQADTVSKRKPRQFETETPSISSANPVTQGDTPTEERRNGVIHGESNRKPQPLWDAVVRAFRLDPVTQAERSRIGRIVRDLKAKGADPDDIPRRLDRYRATWPNAADTPEALLKHWDRFAEPVGILDAEPVTPPDEVFYE